MLELYPNYYSKFTCTADQCPITCCQEWKIAVDDDTYRNWFTIQPPTDVTPQKAHFLPIPLIRRKLVSFA